MRAVAAPSGVAAASQPSIEAVICSIRHPE
jgi:hypothetical protein